MKRSKFLSLAFLLLGYCQQNSAYCQQQNKQSHANRLIQLQTDSIFDKLVEVRKHIHNNPELAGNEVKTQKIIKQYLLNLGLQVRTDAYGYGVIGILKGAKKGRNIAWRAEMDALPKYLPNDAEPKPETSNAQHNCGHDIHMAIALGIAEVLAKNKSSLHGTVYFIFQPEEETFTGAKNMIENTVFSAYKIEEVYSLHVTALPVGEIMVKPNEIFAYQRRIQIALKNSLSTEEVSTLIEKIQASLFRTQPDSKPWEIRSIVDHKIGLANPNTIFKDYLIGENFSSYSKSDTLYIEANLYETDSTNLDNIIPTVRRVIEAGYNQSKIFSVSFVRENPTVWNDPKLTDIAVQALDNVFGKGFIKSGYGKVPFFNDDFAYFQQKIKGVYFLLGGSNFEKEIVAMNHAPDFMADEECIKVGVRSFSSLLFGRLN